MRSFDHLVVNRSLPDIAYRTNPPEETIHPRVIERDEGFFVYCQKTHVPLTEFVHRLAAGESGLWVAGYRPSNRRQSTISFSQSDRLSLTPSIQAILAEIRAAEPATASDSQPSSNAFGEQPAGRSTPARTAMTPEQLQLKLQRQAEIGLQGELAAYRHECLRLADQGCPNPTAYVDHVSQRDVGAGYDIRTDYNGEVRCIEVKGSTSRTDSFFLSENERCTLQDLAEEAYIYLVSVDEADVKASRVLHEIANPFAGDGERFVLRPTEWVAKLRD